MLRTGRAGRRPVAGRVRRAIRHSSRIVARLGAGPSGADAATKSYLRVIARMPEAVAKALHDAV